MNILHIWISSFVAVRTRQESSSSQQVIMVAALMCAAALAPPSQPVTFQQHTSNH